MTHQAQSRNLTDRAHRYRANANPPPGEKRCCLCGSQHQVMVGHVNGREEDSGPENLFWTCRSCNAVCANSLKRAGLGRPTNQYNPATKGAQSLGQWMNAISSMKSEGGTMTVRDAVAMIRATSAEDRSRFARDIWQRRRMHRNSGLNATKKNPAVSGPQYRFAQAVAHGTARTRTSMTKKVARELIEKTPAKLRSQFERKNRKRNLFGFGKSKTTFSSKLSREAFNLGHRADPTDKAFDTWLARKSKIDDLSSSLKSQLRRDYWKGADAYTASKVRKAEDRERKAGGLKKPAGGKTIQYRGHSIIKEDGIFRALGTDWRKQKDAQDYIDLYVATGGKVGRPNPEWSLHQGNSLAIVYETKTNQHTAEVYNSTTGKSQSETFTGPKSFRSAVTWARVMLHEVASPNPKVRAYPRGKAKRNPIDIAEKQFEYFHGAPSKEVLEFQEQEHRHSVLWAIGPLIGMVIRNTQGTKDIEILAPDPETASLTDIVMLCCSEDGRQLFTVGGNQLLKLKEMGSFGITTEDVRDHMLIGTIIQITYRTKKSFEKHGKEEVDFFHDLGKEGSRGVCPVLEYKPRNPSMEIVGGRYEIAKPEAALGGVSPGIVG